jgi:hypothetical protein
VTRGARAASGCQQSRGDQSRRQECDPSRGDSLTVVIVIVGHVDSETWGLRVRLYDIAGFGTVSPLEDSSDRNRGETSAGLGWRRTCGCS